MRGHHTGDSNSDNFQGRTLTRAIPNPSRKANDRHQTRTMGVVTLPAELRRLVRQRLVFLAKLEVAVWCIAFLYMSITPFLPGVTTTHLVLLPQFIVCVLMAGASGSLWRIASDKNHSPEYLLSLGLAFAVLTAGAVAMMENGLPYQDRPTPSGVSFACVWVVFYPLVVPARPTLAAVTACIGALMPAVTLLIMRPIGISDRSYTDIGAMVLNAGVATLLATVSSRFIYRLANKIDHARELGSYRLIRKLGEGGMGVVWTAQHRYLARSAAIKLIRKTNTPKPGADVHLTYEQFQREADAIASLESPNTVALYDYGVSDDDDLYFVMEHLHGVDLRTLVKRHGAMPTGRMCYLIRQVCDSLEEAHTLGLVHRDIKPANIMVCRYAGKYDHVKVLDFGLVQRNTANSESDIPARIVGTPAYMPPENLKPPYRMDSRGDLYAVASVAYWLVSGLLVFEGNTDVDIAVKRLKGDAPTLRSRGIDIPECLESVIMQGLARHPQDRFESVAMFSQALADAATTDWNNNDAKQWWNEVGVLQNT